MNTIVSLISIEHKRLFYNQFDLEILDDKGLDEKSFRFSIEKYNFNENNSLSISYEESIFLPRIDRGKYPQTLSITVREFGDFTVLRYINDWYGEIFSREKNCFRKSIKENIRTINIYYSEYGSEDRKILYSVKALPREVPIISGEYTSDKPITYTLAFFIVSFNELEKDTYSWR